MAELSAGSYKYNSMHKSIDEQGGSMPPVNLAGISESDRNYLYDKPANLQMSAEEINSFKRDQSGPTDHLVVDYQNSEISSPVDMRKDHFLSARETIQLRNSLIN